MEEFCEKMARAAAREEVKVAFEVMEKKMLGARSEIEDWWYGDQWSLMRFLWRVLRRPRNV